VEKVEKMKYSTEYTDEEIEYRERHGFFPLIQMIIAAWMIIGLIASAILNIF
jgi:hypothetical protein